MNHIYRIVWNHATACYQAVTECAKGQGKTAKGSNAREALERPQTNPLQRMPLTTTALGAALCMLSLPGFAGPSGGQVTTGSATISQTGNATTINQTSSKAAIDWTRFSVGSHESVRFNQPSASAITLNRVTGTESSAIMGSLSANGQVFILNPNGVLIGNGAQVNVGGLVASTMKLDNASFMAGNYKFTGDGAGSVVNNGTITVAPGGTLALMAPVVQNTGTLSAPGGSVLLAGAQGVTLTLQTDGGLVAYTLDSGSVQTLVDNGGLIQADGGHVVLTAKGVDALSQAVVNHSGVIEAQTVGNKSGVIELLGDMQSGAVHLSGKLDASAPNGGDGGFIDTSAAQVKIADTAKVTTAAAAGQTGIWLIDPTDFTIGAGSGSRTTSSMGAATLAASLGSTDVNIATSETGTGNGDIFVNSAVDWSANKLTLSAHQNININANLNGSGTARLALNYGQGTSDGAGSDYILRNSAKINLPAGQNFSAKQGSTGAVKNYTVITSLGVAGSITGTDLQGINGNLADNYVLGGDINASATSGWNSGSGFMQIGYQNNPFSGVLDGFGHTVSNLYINRPNDIEVGLIGTLTQGSVKNISTIDVSITGHSIVGGLIGAMRWGSTLKNAYSTGTVKGTGQALSSGQIDGATGIGGLVGGATPYISYPSDGYSFCISCISIDSSASNATVYGNSAIGGLIGFTDQIIIRNSYAAGSVNGLTIGNQSSSYIGGLVGTYFNSTELSYSYSSARVQSTGSNYVGGLVGDSSGYIAPSTFFDSQKSGVLSSAGGTGKTTAEMQQKSTYADWDFVNTWRMVEGSSYPMLRALTQSKITLSASARDIEKVYDKTAWHGGIMDYSGFISGDTTGNLSGTLKWVGTAEGAVNAGNYTLVPSGFSSQKYEIEYVPGTLTIQPRPLDITVSKTYNGNATFNSGFAVTKGVVAGDATPTISGTATVSSGNAGTYTAFSTNNLLTDKPNYTANPQYVYSGVLGKVAATIDPAALSLIGISGSRTYDGTRNANWNDNTYLVGDVLEADKGKVSLVSGTGTLASKNVGTQALTDLGTLQLGGAAAGNYQLSKGTSSWTISPASLGITGKADTRTYNGTTNATGSIFKYSGQLFGSDSLSGGKLVFEDANAGVDKFVKVSGVTVADGNGGRNYSISYMDGWGTIDPAVLGAVGISGSRTYDGTRNANWNDNTYLVGDVLEADKGKVSLVSGTGTLASKNIGTQALTDLGTLKLGGAAAGNYQLSKGTSSWTISPASLGITGKADTRTYNGTTNATGSIFKYSGQLFGSDSLSGGKLVFEDANAGVDKFVKVSGVTVADGNGGRNYSISYLDGWGTIDPAVLGAVGISGSRTYDGTKNANWNDNTYLVGDVLEADKGKVSLVSGTGTLASKNVGTQALTDLGTLKLGGAAAGNYQLSKGTSSWTISPASLGITGKADTRTYNGTTNATGSIFKYSGQLFGSDSLSGGKLVFEDANAGVDKFVKVSGVTVADGNGGRNYSISYMDGWGTIDPAVLGAVGISGSRTYDGTRNANWNDNTYLVGDVLEADKGKVSLVSGTGTLASKNIGTQALTDLGTLKLGGAAAGNYQLSKGTSSWTISPASLGITGKADTRTYNGTTNATGSIFKYSGQLFGSDTLSGGKLVFEDANAGVDKFVKVSGVTVADGNGGRNYNILYMDGWGTIDPAALSITVSKIYNGNATFTSGFSVTDGVVTGDATPTISGTATVSSGNAGSYTAFSTNNLLTDNPNYTANPQNGYSGELGKLTAIINPADKNTPVVIPPNPAIEAGRLTQEEAHRRYIETIGYISASGVNSVFITRSGTNTQEIISGGATTYIKYGDTVQTKDGLATIEFSDGSTLRLDTDTTVQVSPSSNAEITSGSIAQDVLSDGRLWGRILTRTGVNLGGPGIIAGTRG